MTEAGEPADRPRRPGTLLGVAALAVALVTLVLWVRDLRALTLPEDTTLYVVAFLLSVVLGISAFFTGTRWYGGLAALPAILIGLLLPFTIAINTQSAADPIQVGDTIPYFSAVDDQGQPFSSDALHGHLLLVKFFRAHW